MSNSVRQIIELFEALPESEKHDAVMELIRRGPNAKKDAATESEKQEARNRFERHFGEVDLGYPTGIDNEAIDADLAREYGDRHEER